MTFLMKGKTINNTLRDKHCSNTANEGKNNFHITANGRLAINGDLTDDELKNANTNFCVEAIIVEGEKKISAILYYTINRNFCF